MTDEEFNEEAKRRGFFRCLHNTSTQAINGIDGFTIKCGNCGMKGRTIWEDELREYLDDTSAFFPSRGSRRKLPPPTKND